MLVWRMAGHGHGYGHAEMAGGCMAHTREGHQGREALLGHAEVAGGLAKERRQAVVLGPCMAYAMDRTEPNKNGPN